MATARGFSFEGLRLAEILDLHTRYQEVGGLFEVLGDGFLYAHNPIFRNLRNLARHFDIRHSADDFCDYRAASLASLPTILERKLIPYVGNARVLQRLEEMHPTQFIMSDCVDVTPNHILHEEAHCIANQILPAFPLKRDTRGWRRSFILRIEVAESFANALDSISMYYVDSPGHAFFQAKNSYSQHTKMTIGWSSNVAKCIELLGFSDLLALMILGFLHSNFLYRRLGRAELEDSLGLLEIRSKFSAQDISALLSLFRWALGLNIAFRTQTSSFFLKAFGGADFKSDILKIMDINFIKALQKDDSIMEAIRCLADLTYSGTRSKYLEKPLDVTSMAA